MERVWCRTSRKSFPVRILVALSIAVPLSLTPIWSEDSARAVTPELVAFSQAGVSAAPTEWANRILVEDFNDPSHTTAQLNSDEGITSPVGTFNGSGNLVTAILNADQYGGAPCNDCGTASSTTTVTPWDFTISSEYNPDDPYAYGSNASFPVDVSTNQETNYLSDAYSVNIRTTQNLASATSLVITANTYDPATESFSLESYNAEIVLISNNYWAQNYDLYITWSSFPYVRLEAGSQFTLTVSGQTTEEEYTTTPGADGVNKFPSVGNGEITLTLASSSTYRYLGFWWSAGSPNNNICLLPETGSTCIAQYNTRDLLENASFDIEGLSGPAWQSKPHYGNPRGRVYSNMPECNGVANIRGNLGTGHCNEPFAFIHIFQDSGFHRVRFFGDTNTGFEFDNVTVSTAASWELLDLLPDGEILGASALPKYSINSPSVIPVDPRSDSVPFPGVLLGGDASAQPNATLCVTEVDSAGTPVDSDPSNLLISANVPLAVTAQSSAPRYVYSGPRETIVDLSETIRINNAANSIYVVNSESKYLRISVQAATGTGLTTCSGSNNVITAVTVELRPIRITGSHRAGIAID